MTYEVTATHTLYEGPIFSVRKDNVTMPGGEVAGRDVVDHKDAVAVVALDHHDGSSLVLPMDNIALVYQYRHPLGRHIWELPAGLLDVAGENAKVAAARELQEETGVVAANWEPLVTVASSPGFTNETVQVYLATGIQRFPRTGTGEDDEEADMKVVWVPLDHALRMVDQGVIVSAHTVAGIMATARKMGI